MKNSDISRKKSITKISVIVPICNVDRYLKKCMDTIVNQTLKDIEIICVNDGSSDDSANIINEYASRDKRITVITQENQGLSVARNSGMAVATGEYIGFVDSDDWIALNFFEKLYEVAKKYDADISCCSFSRTYPSGRSRKKVVIQKEGEYVSVHDKFHITNTPRMCQVFNKIYRRNVLEKIDLKFQPGVYFEDVAFTIRALFYSKKLATTPGTSYYYRANENSIMRGEQTDKKQHDLIAARKNFIEFAKEHYIRCSDRYFIQEKIFHKFCGVTVMKIYVWETIKKYYLFGLVKVWETRHSI